jgi:hypothetical protein
MASIRLRVIPQPAGDRRVLNAPPVISVAANTNHYLCGKCGTLLVVAEPGQLSNLVVCCRECGAYNELDS